MRRKKSLRHKKGASQPPKRKNALAERYRRRRINLWHKVVDLHDVFGVRSYTVLKDDKNTWELNSDPTRPGWPPTASVTGSTGRRVCLTMDECRRGPTPRRRNHHPRACKTAEQEEEEEAAGENEEEGEEEGEKEEEEESAESPINQDDEDGEAFEDVADGAAYQPMEVAEAAVEESVEEAVVAQIDHSIEERVKRIRDMWDVPDSPIGVPNWSINKGLTSHPPASPTSTVQEEPPLTIAGPATCPPAPVTPLQTPRKPASLLPRSNSVRIKRRLLERWRSLAAIQARRSAWRSFSSLMKQLDDGY